ncbi:DUF2793 domain-containing protein [Aliiroseovarius subalbicans]|uniref:DUF2793 domain-containing protein n=1 Tax=Aliiroseovarius subalbicans TaxID=2925840 RepID=UPI001F574ADC|nr:DUF2793 domain-containing protein [Aliiroseovarius subalbicans]MCI2397797.1 DUF2793 domain-containing protein [Aliiroseovarius subalbicans]
MSNTSANLSLPYIQPSQAQKHVTHNEAVRMLDSLVQLSVLSASQTTPPAIPDDGDGFILPVGVAGAWAGHDADLAVYQDNTWVFYTPGEGLFAWVQDIDEHRVFDGTDWIVAAGVPELQNLDMVGIQTTADASNRLSVASAATLLTHAGAGHQLKLNKAANSDTASLLFQTNWSGRAEMGTTGSDDFEIKVSPDGSTFHQAMTVDQNSGEVSFPSGINGLASPDFGDGSLITTDYMAAKGVDLIANGTGLLGNAYNHPAEFTYDPIQTPNLPASFSCSGHYPGVVKMQERIPVDPNQVYRLNCYVRQEGLSGDWSAYANEERHRHYMGLACEDQDGNTIESQHHMRYHHSGTDSLTTLAAPLTPGDTSVQVVDASGWNETASQSYNRGLIIFGYKNAAGALYSHYSRIVGTGLFDLGQVNKTSHTITLNQPLPASLGNPADGSGTWPVGTPLANASKGGALKYSFFGATVLDQTDTWYRINNYTGGIDLSGTNQSANFAPGTSRVQVFWLPNYSNRSGGYSGFPDTGAAHRVWFTGTSVVPEPHAVQKEEASGAYAGRKLIKVPYSDFDAGTITLVAPARVVTEI